MDNITPRQAIKFAENSPNLTPKERQKILALALVCFYNENKDIQSKGAMGVIIEMLWNFSKMINPAIPDFDPQFIVEINQNPGQFVEYR